MPKRVLAVAIRRTGIFAALIAAVFLGINNAALPIVYGAGGNPQTVLLLRYLFFVGFFPILCLAMGRSLRLQGNQALTSFGCGIVFTLGTLALLGSFVFIPVSLAILVVYLFPIFTSIFESILDRRWPGWGQAFCLLFALAGLAFALDVNANTPDLRGLVLAVAAAILIAVSLTWNGRKLAEADPTVVTIYMAISGIVLVCAIILASDSFALPRHFDQTTIAALTAVVVLFAIAFATIFQAVRLIGATPTAMIMNLEPVFTMASAYLLLSEQLTQSRILGGGVVLAAVMMSQILNWRADGA